MSRSISPSDLRAEATSKVTPDRCQAVFDFGDFGEGVFFHAISLSSEFRISNFEWRMKNGGQRRTS